MLSHLHSSEAMDGVAEHGTGLKKLQTQIIDLKLGEPFHRMLKVTGKTLMSLRVQIVEQNFVDDIDLNTIFCLCPHVTDLEVGKLCPWGVVGGVRGDQIELLCLYGVQLQGIIDIMEGGTGGVFTQDCRTLPQCFRSIWRPSQ